MNPWERQTYQPEKRRRTRKRRVTSDKLGCVQTPSLTLTLRACAHVCAGDYEDDDDDYGGGGGVAWMEIKQQACGSYRAAVYSVNIVCF